MGNAIGDGGHSLMPMQFIALVDIDHTVRNAFPRDNMIDAETNWDDYHAAGAADKSIETVCNMVRALHASNWLIIGVTAIPDKFRGITNKWLVENNVPFDELLMRKDEDFRPAPEIKMQLVKERFGERMKNEVTVVFDDREDVVEAFASEGLTAVQVHGRKD